MTRMQYNTLIARFQLTRLSSKEQKKMRGFNLLVYLRKNKKKSNFNAIFFINSFDFPIRNGAVHRLRIQVFGV